MSSRNRRRRNSQPRRAPNTALAEGVYDAVLDGSTIDPDDYAYRPLTAGPRGNNLPSYQHGKMLSVARYLGRTNAVGARLLTVTSDFVYGEGAGYSTQNELVKDVLDAHWRDPINDWDRHGPSRLRRYFRDGCMLMPLFPTQGTGHMTVGTVPADWIDHVDTDPENWENVTSVTLKKRAVDAVAGKTYTIVNRRMSAAELAGVSNPALYWSSGNDDGQRGISLLYPIADYLDLLDQLLFSEVERALLLKAFVWDVTLDGMEPNQIAAWVKNNPSMASGPKPGSVFAHNQQISLNAITPSLGTGELADFIRFLRNHVLGYLGMPEHWYSEGGDVNRSVGTVMAEVPRKRFTALQDEWRFILQDVCQAQIDYATLYGGLASEVAVQDSQGVDTSETVEARDAFTIQMADLSGDDVAKLMPAIQQLTATLSLAEGEVYISKQTARVAFLTFLGQIGVDINIEEEAQRAEQEAQDRKDEQAQLLHAQQPPVALAAYATQRDAQGQPSAQSGAQQAVGGD